MINSLHRSEIEALADGYSGLRVVDDMSWTLDAHLDADSLIEGEIMLNEYLAHSRTTVLCDYGHRRFDAALIHDVMRTHPTVALGEIALPNPYLDPPELLSGEEREPTAAFKRRRAAWWISQLTRTMVAEEQRLRTEEALDRARDSLQRAVQATAHEIKQPLSGVITNADAALRWLEHVPPDLKETRGGLDRILRDARRATAILDRIRALVVGSPEARSEVDMSEVVRDAIRDIDVELLDASICLTCDLAAPLPPVFADRIHLQQCVLNLVINAIEALETVSDRPRELRIGAAMADPGHLHIEVADSGPGFDRWAADHLFDPFFSTKPCGLGLGLSICRATVEACGGEISAAPNQPHGACFRIRLPATLPRPA
jgi:signal transduction histidine kinase